MSDNERELISLVRGSKDPEKAIVVAVEIIVEFLAMNI